MSKGGPSFGKHQKTTHLRCRRCGHHSFHKKTSICAACGFGRTATIRSFGWQNKRLGKRLS